MAEYLAKLQEKTWLSRELTLSFSGVVDEKTAFFLVTLPNTQRFKNFH